MLKRTDSANIHVYKDSRGDIKHFGLKQSYFSKTTLIFLLNDEILLFSTKRYMFVNCDLFVKTRLKH
jgi:hypothetical protein